MIVDKGDKGIQSFEHTVSVQAETKRIKEHTKIEKQAIIRKKACEITGTCV